MKLTKIVLWLGIAAFTFATGTGAFALLSYLGGFDDEEEFRCYAAVTQPATEPSPIAVAPLPIPVVVPADAEETCDLSATGDYSAIAPVRGKFEGFEGVSLVVDEWNEALGESVPVKPGGWIFWQKRELKLASLNVKGGKVSFATKTRNGVKFTFEGKLVSESLRLKDEVSGEWYDQRIDLKGVLIRVDNGRITASTAIQFEATCGC